MSAHVLLKLLNELGKRGKMRGLPSILPLFRSEFNKFKNTGARMLDSISHQVQMQSTLYLLVKSCFSVICCLFQNIILQEKI